MRKTIYGALFLAPILAAAQTASPNVNAEFLRPTPGNNFLGVRSAQLLTHKLWRFEALLNYADDPAVVLEQRNDLTIKKTKIVDSQSGLDLMAAIGVKNYLEFGMAIPVALFQSGEIQQDVNTAAVQSGKLGDIRLAAKARILGDATKSEGFFLSFTPELTLPTGSGQNFFGAKSASGLLAFTGTWTAGRIGISASAGPRFQKEEVIANLVIGNNLETQLAASYKIAEKFTFMAEVDGTISLENNARNAGQLPFEARTGLHVTLAKNLIMPVGLGVGLTDGLGTPDARILVGIIYSPTKEQDLDPDKDGLLGEADKCPTDPEDLDKVEDNDGCPEDNDKDGIADKDDTCVDVPGVAAFKGCPDSDGDKIADLEDKCPNEPGVQELQGCPIPDRDKDGIADVSDLCPDIPGQAQYQGCPDSDNDGLADNKDTCPNEAEDKDSFEDEDGCPELDNDKDLIADKDDLCPAEKEDKKGKAPKDGCPDTTKAVFIDGNLFILDKVFFDVNKDTIKKGPSFAVLDAVVKVLKDHPEVKKIRVEGHTDDQGSDAANLDLSKRRAKRVLDYLVSKGIEADRLESEGYGEGVPLVPFATIDPKKNKKELTAARDKNRRVQFTILDPKPAEKK